MGITRVIPSVLATVLTMAHAGAMQLQPSAVPPTPSASQAVTPGVPTGSLTREELEQLLGPIALYPDELLANVLAAAVYPDEVAEAAASVGGGAQAASIAATDWEPPVKAVARIPDVIRMMGEFPDWTTALGQAYLTQAQDVMRTVQELRRKARANGALADTPQQKVVVEQETVYVKSADPEVVYVPSYSPSVVYVDDDDDEWVAGAIGFTTGIVVGAVWADLACDWNHGCVGWGGNNINIERGDINVGGDVNIGSGNRNRVEHRNRVGKEGAAWSPNTSKPLATSRAAASSNLRASGVGTGGRVPSASSAARPAVTSRGPAAGGTGAQRRSQPAAGARPAPARPSGAAPARAQPTPARVPQAPSADRAASAFQGGPETRAASSRGSSSRQSMSGGSRSGSRPAGGGGRGGGGRGGGGRGGGRR